MKSLRKLRGLAALNNRGEGVKERKRGGHHLRATHLDEVLQATQDMQDMKNCYDSLLSAAAATANSAFEFSEALREMGACLLEKTALNDDEESGRVLLMLGKAQFELQKIVDSYRSHVTKTITTPSESLLNELRNVEEMKRHCDEKREVYDYMLTSQRDKSKSKNIKGEAFSSEQLKSAQEEYDEEATLFIFRLKSLKQGQSRSLLTQAARHHAAQLSLFQKGIGTLEKIEPYVKQIADQLHIDYHFSGLEDDGSDDGDYLVNEGNDDGELSFDYGHGHPQEGVATSRNSMEVDQVDSLPTLANSEIQQENLEKAQLDLMPVSKGSRLGSHSEPLFLEKKFDPAEKFKDMRSSSKKVHSYVLPMPVDGKSSSLTSSHASSTSNLGSTSVHPMPIWHSSPLEPYRTSKDVKSQLSRTPSLPKAQSILKDSNIHSEATKLPPPSPEELSFAHVNQESGSDSKKIKRHAFSGPIISKAWSGKPVASRSSIDHPQSTFSVPLRAASNQHSTSPKVSPAASPLRSSPQLSELHELPRPPPNVAKFSRPPNVTGYSAPLGPRTLDISSVSKIPSISTHMPSPLPTPPITIARSYSIPSSSQRAMSVSVAKLLEMHPLNLGREIASPATTTILSGTNQELSKGPLNDPPAPKLRSEP